YSLGTVFYMWRQLPFSHAIWHLFVLGGSVSHYLGVLFYIVAASG
ncbi:MAG: hemolysin D, partial [Proteobacteria bacterium]|nr:hemolysin D [Pseudomonadota bacterium]